MIGRKKIDILLSSKKMENVFRKKEKALGIPKERIKNIRIKIAKKYIDNRSFSLVAVYDINNIKKIVGVSKSDGKKRYAFRASKEIAKQIPKSTLFSASKPYCYIKSLELFLREYIEGNNLGRIIREKREIKSKELKRAAEIIAFFQRIKIQKGKVRNGIDFSNIEKNIKILKERKGKEGKEISQRFKRIKKGIAEYQKHNKKKVLAHGDLQPYNIFLKGRKTKIADFDKVHFGDRVSDLASFISHITTSLDFNIKKGNLSFEKELLNNYQKRTKRLKEFEKGKLKTYIEYFNLLIASHILVWGNKAGKKEIKTKIKL